jgi:peptidoglycan/LPS O-acetylase OafA/YrhL
LKSDPGHTFRANGLDTLRAAAITLVFMNHYMAFVSGTPTFGWGSVIGWTGVDLFFVLSGYLIANQIFSGLARGATLSLRLFYARRALRTLPVFWLVLALYFLFPAVMGGNTPPPLWRFLTFTQNIGLHPGTAFSHAWSLCIEEQFYLVLPLVLYLGARFEFHRSQGWTLLLALLLIGVGSRVVLWLGYGGENDGYYPHIYYATLCRFDQFLPGIALWSYSIYLSHKAVMIILRRLLQPFDPAPFVLTGVVATASVMVGALLYLLVESPFMAIRSRVFPTSFTAEPGRQQLRTLPATAQTPGGEF